MHFSAKRGIAIACRLSVCLSVTLVDCDHIQQQQQRCHRVQDKPQCPSEKNLTKDYTNKKAVLPQGNRAMPQVFFSVEVRQQHSLQV